MNLRIILIVLLTIPYSLFPVRYSLSQSLPGELDRRLTKTWKLTSLEQEGKAAQPDQSQNDFVLIINSDHTVKQGMYPDGLIGGTWSVNEKEMLLTIKDETMNQQYKIKIVLLTADELILQDLTNTSALKIHYSAK